MAWGGALMATGNRPGDVAADPVVLARAAEFLVPAGQPGGP
jgi:hypothetical protein